MSTSQTAYSRSAFLFESLLPGRQPVLRRSQEPEDFCFWCARWTEAPGLACFSPAALEHFCKRRVKVRASVSDRQQVHSEGSADAEECLRSKPSEVSQGTENPSPL